MRKTDKKLDNQIRLALTDVCEEALKSVKGFEWLIHTVNYSQFPESLRVICVFDTNACLEEYNASSLKDQLTSQIQAKLKALNIRIKNIENTVCYDTEEACEKQHEGNWAKRLSGR